MLLGVFGALLGLFGLSMSIDLPFLYRLMLSITMTAVGTLDIIITITGRKNKALIQI
jgi:hypothetical protein